VTIEPAAAAGGSAALSGQTVVVLGGSAGIGLETARLARSEGAEVILTGRDPERLSNAAGEVGALGTAAFDVTDEKELEGFFAGLQKPIDHLMLSGSGPYYATLAEMDFDRAREDIERHLLLPLRLGLAASETIRPGGSLVFIGGTGGRRRGAGLSVIGAVTAALPALVANLAVELAPIRVNVVAPGFVDTDLSARLLGDQIDARREELRATLPVGRVIGPKDVAALAVQVMSNTALTGAVYDVDGGQQLLA
jgi:NAD(P)-dependent dehydrogenase (short-subunit alcohol dehydrogenase family)